jgi:hypothetical protein
MKSLKAAAQVGGNAVEENVKALRRKAQALWRKALWRKTL